jgi:prolyl-tRNA synthetase
MKDLYSFHASEDDLFRFYEEVKQAYLRSFQRCGLEVVPVAAESGSIGGAVSHEFALIADTGEDTVAQCPECGFGAKQETLGAGRKHCPKCQALLTLKSCVESGHIFQLGMKYSKAMNARFTTEAGTQAYFTMGCYGIGVGRLLAAIVEASHDERGIIWPAAVAPYDIHLLSLHGQTEALDLASALVHRGFQVLLDDRRDASAGEKFADSELIGIPVQVIVSERGIKENRIEVRPRSDVNAAVKISREDIDALVGQIRTQREHPHA